MSDEDDFLNGFASPFDLVAGENSVDFSREIFA